MNFESWWQTFTRENPSITASIAKEIALAAWMGAITNGMVNQIKEQPRFCYATFTSFGVNKLAVIKAVRESTNWGLKESKDWVESCPHALTPKDGYSSKELVEWVDRFKYAGGYAEMVIGNTCDRCEMRFKCFTER